ncbi:PDDEXK nuclease domain-containing protein [Rhodoferax sp. U11-2br]|uniref:PDDEXK nuclease domain-containing protein n=1 Tax=Rhodoferax sp. U11-2br TaxID=2838878 RepID=UPI002036F0A3|nr:PDDEXK nuclease domain-containing protein [Rhodoferax sp. U11-2br]
MTPETKARQQIDQKLEQAGWVIQDMKQLNLSAGVGIAVREYPTDTGPADYVLFVNREAAGVIEAKKDDAGENLTVAERQSERYASANLKWRKDSTQLRFLFEATGQIIRFTDNLDPAPRSREIFHFFKPETLAAWAAQPATLRRRLAEQMPALPERNLRGCQISAVTGLEKSLALNKPRALVHMATGAGKTFTAITSVYRLLKFGGAKRILFLVDTRNLGKQAHQEFMAYTPPDDAILRELEHFLLELGVGFSFVARQRRIQLDSDDFYIDLLFYNRKLRRLVAVELKLGEFRAEYKGQMELYLRWLAKYDQEPGDLPPLGIILCTGKKNEQIELLELDKSGIHVAD